MNEQTIFTAALARKNPDERQAFLNEACGGDAGLRAQVEELLVAGEGADSFLEHPPAGVDATVDASLSGKDTVDNELIGALPPLEPCDKPDRIGKLGGYEIIEVVGQGGMGTVLRAFDTKLSRIVALKVMASELAANPTAVKRFLREAISAAAVVHDHVVTIHAVDDQSRPPYLVMEFIQGQTLQQKIDREGALPLKQILRIGSQMAAGLAAAHKTGLIHRDVKPANILLENGVQRVKITDFGLARAADDVEMTKTGLIAGTPQYMSPEQARGEQIDIRSDLFSLGSVLYAMCTGRPPFRAESTMGTLRRVCDDTPRPIHEVNAEIPPWLSATIDKLLAKRPEDRFQSAAEVADLLSQFLAYVQQPATMPLPTAPILAAVPIVALPSKDDYVHSPQRSSGVGIILAICLAVLVLPFLAFAVLLAAWFLFSSASLERRTPTVSSYQGGHASDTTSETLPAKLLDEGWTSLFNGQDLAGWKGNLKDAGAWRVENGELVGEGQKSLLFLEGRKFQDFQLRVEANINKGGDSGVVFRATDEEFEGEPRDLVEANIHAGRHPSQTGSIWETEELANVKETLAPANTWFTLEVIAVGNHVMTKVNGQPAGDTTKVKRTQSGRLALQVFMPGTKVRFRRVEIKERSPSGNPPFAVAPFGPAQAREHQTRWAAHLGVDAEATNSIGMRFQLIPPGEFEQGSTDEELERWREAGRKQDLNQFFFNMLASEGPQHHVVISKPFYMAATEVTRAQFQKFVEAKGYKTAAETDGKGGGFFEKGGALLNRPELNWKNPGIKQNEDTHPVTQVTWDDALAFCQWLSEKEGHTCRLPTEAEWEYACRAGTTTSYHGGDTLRLTDVDDPRYIGGTNPVELLAPNPFGLFGMHTNVIEWCSDFWDQSAYSRLPARVVDPVGPQDGTKRVQRDGAWGDVVCQRRSATRRGFEPSERHTGLGFRVVMEVRSKGVSENKTSGKATKSTP